MSQTQTRKYKATFILDTRGQETTVEQITEMLSETINGVGGNVNEVSNLGRIEFVRVTDRNHTGDSYLEFYFDGDAAAPEAITDKLHLEKAVKRVLIERQ